MTKIRKQIEELVQGSGEITSEIIEHAETKFRKDGLTLAGLNVFTDTLLLPYQQGRMPQNARKSFKEAIGRLHHEVAEGVSDVIAVRGSSEGLKKRLQRTDRLIRRYEKLIKNLDAKLANTVAEIDRLEARSTDLIDQKKTLLGDTVSSKGKLRTASAFSAMAGIVPGLKLLKAAPFAAGAGPLGWLAIGFGGLYAYKNWQKAEQLSEQVSQLEAEIKQSSTDLRSLKTSRGHLDDNIVVLKGALDTYRTADKACRDADRRFREFPYSAMASLACRLRIREKRTYHLKQQISVLKKMNVYAEEFRNQVAGLVRSLEKEIQGLERASREAEAELISVVLGTVLSRSKIGVMGRLAISDVVLRLKVGPEVTMVEKLRRTVAALEIDRSAKADVTDSAAELVEAIEKLSQAQADALSWELNEGSRREQLSEPQRFLVDVILSGLSVKIDQPALLDWVAQTKVSDDEAREVARLITNGATFKEVRKAFESRMPAD